jgi:hypothetical protein
MFCPRCGTKAATNSPRFCYECGAEIPPAGETRASGAEEGFDRAANSGPKGYGASPTWDPRVMTHVFTRDRSWRPVLIAGGLLLLLPLAIPLIFGAVVASAFAGIALVALLVKALPVLAIVALVYWALSRPRRYTHQGR